MPDTARRAAPILIPFSLLALLLTACGEGASSDAAAPQRAEVPASATAAAPPAEGGPEVPVDESLEPILEALREPDAFARAAKLATLLPTLDAGTARSVRHLLRNPRLELGAVENALLLRFWAIHDAENAAAWALFRSPPARRAASIEIALARHAQEDPEKAAQLLEAYLLAPGAIVNVAENAVVSGWFASGKPGLEDYIRNLGIGYSRQRAVARFARELTRRDGPEAALAWAESIPDDDKHYKKDALRQAGGAVAILHPLVAAAWCDRVCSQELATNLRAVVAQRWALTDGPAAMDWISRAPEGQEREWAVRAAFRGWWNEDPEGFRRWMDARSGDGVGPWLQPLVEVYAPIIAPQTPENALEWAARIEDDEARERATIAVARIWRRSDEEAAEAWLAESGLSEEVLERVRLEASPGAFRSPRAVVEPESDEAASEPDAREGPPGPAAQ